MGDDEHAEVGLAGDRVDPVGDGVERVDVQARVGLVEDGDLGALERELEDLQALLLAAREALVEVARGELARDVGELHRLLDELAEVLERDLALAARLAVGVHDHPQVLRDGHARDRDGVLEGHEEAHAGPLVGVGLGDVLALEEDLALGHLEVGLAHDHVGQRRLAGAVGAHEGVDLALADREVEPLEDLLVAGPDVEVADLEISHVLSVSWCESDGDGRRRGAKAPACARRRRRARRASSGPAP